MRHARRFGWVLVAAILAGFAFLVTGPGRAGEEEAKKAEELPVRTYRIEDLFLQRDWSAGSASMPDMLELERPYYAACVGGFGDLFGGKKDGKKPEGGPIGWQGLVDLIRRVLNSESDPKVAPWHDEGVPAAIEYLCIGKAQILIVTQTPHGHERIEELLEAFRAESEVGGPMLTIHARWIEVDEAKAADLLGRGPKRAVPMQVSAADLEKAGGRTVYRAATTTFDRMKVFLAAGKLKTFLADVEAVVTEESWGVDPTIGAMLVGALLEVHPMVSQRKDTVLLDYRSYVNHGGSIERRPLPDFALLGGAREPMKVDVDLAEVDFQTLRGSVRIPFDKTILLGLTTGPKLQEGKVCALLVEVSASK
jgi:hypothetical protein